MVPNVYVLLMIHVCVYDSSFGDDLCFSMIHFMLMIHILLK